jgi:hypothetical protein
MNEQRRVILESDRAGQAITAPLADAKQVSAVCRMRWIQREESFSLQYYHLGKGWIDVPVVKEEKP